MKKQRKQKDFDKSKLDYSLKLMVKTSFFIFIITILSKIFNYAYRIIIARYFGPEIYGLFSLATIILLWFVSFSALGLFEGIARFISFYRGKGNLNKARYVFRFSLIILFFSGILAGLILYLFSEFISINIFHDNNLIIFLKIFSFTIPLSLFSGAFKSLIQAFEKIKALYIIQDFLQIFIKLVFIILLIIIGLKTNAVILSYCLGVFGIFIVSYLYCKYKIHEIFNKIELGKQIKGKIKRELFFYSYPLIFLCILDSIITNIDSFTIGYFKGALEVGIYNSAIPIAMLLVFFPSLFTGLFFPLIIREFSKRKISMVRELSKQIEKWILIVNLPLFLLIVLFPGAFINILFGSEYLAAENALRFLAAGFLFYSLSMILSNLILTVGKSKLILINILAVSFFNLALNILLIPRYGIAGAAFATMLGQAILFLILFLQVKNNLSIILLKRKMWRVLFSAIPPTILLIYIKQFIPVNLLTLVLQGFFFVLFYLFLIFVTKSMDKNDLMILGAIKKKLT